MAKLHKPLLCSGRETHPAFRAHGNPVILPAMKPSTHPFLRPSALASAAAISLSTTAPAAIWQWDGGDGSAHWQSAANWNADVDNVDFNGTFANRLNVNGAQKLIYSASEGTTTYTGDTITGGGRGLTVGNLSSGTMEISGGTFSTLGAPAGDVIGNGNNSTGILTIHGGVFIGTNAGTSLGIGTGAGRVSTLNISSGKATLATLNLNSSDADVNLSGSGELEVNSITMTGGSTGNISFNGGTLRARTATTTFLQGLTGANIHSGGLTVDTNGVTITIGQALLAGTVSGGLTKTGAGTLTLTGTNTYTGATTLSQGSLSVSASAHLGAAASTLVFDGGTLQITGAALTSFSGIGHTVSFHDGKTVGLDINSSSTTFTADQALNQGSGGLTKLGAGKLILNQNNTYSGDTTISAGSIIKTTADSATGNVSVASGASLVLRGGITDGSGQSLTLDGGGINTGGYFFSGSAVLRGALQAQTGSNTWAGDILVNSANTRIGVQDGASLTLTGTITGTSPLFRAGNANSDIILNGTASWTGSTTLFSSCGSIRMGGDNKLSSAATGYFSSGGSTVLDLNGYQQEFAGINSDGTIASATITNRAASTTSILTSNTPAATSFAYRGGIADGDGSVAFTKTGEGTQTLTAANTYTGITTIRQGILSLGSSGSIANSPTILIADGATLDVSQVPAFTIGSLQTLTGSGTVLGNATIQGTLEIGSSPGTMTFGGNLVLLGTSNFELNSSAFTAGSYDLASGATGAVSFGGILNLFFNASETYPDHSSVQIFNFGGGYSGQFTSVNYTGLGLGQSASFDSSTGFVTVIPEPAGVMLGCLGMLLMLRRRRA